MIVSKFLRSTLILSGIFLAFLLFKLIFSLIFPIWLPWPIPSLPEDLFWTFLFTLVKELILDYPVIILSSVILTFSFWLKESELFQHKNYGQPKGKTLVAVSILLIAASALFSFLTLFVQPTVENILAGNSYKFQLTQALEKNYLALKAQPLHPGTGEENLVQEKKLSLLQRLATLRPSQRNYSKNETFDYEFEIQILTSHMQLEEFFLLRTLPGVEKESPVLNRTVEELLSVAEEKLHEKNPDYYTSNLLAYQVFLRLTNSEQRLLSTDSRLNRAKAVIDQSWTAIYSKTLSENERLKASYFFRKGKSLGDFQFQNYLEAYYGFLELHNENPGDEDVNRHLNLAKEKLKDQVLFTQDMDVLFVAPGSENIVFRNPDPSVEKSGAREIIRIKKILDTPQGVYVAGFELLRFNVRGEILLHWVAPYGKWTNQGIDFRAWNKDTPVNAFPVVLKESPGNTYLDPDSATPPLFKMNLTTKELQSLNDPRLLPHNADTGLLMVQGDTIAALGVSPIPLQTEFFTRLLGPFGFLILLYFVFYFSWLLRAQNMGQNTPALWRFLIVLLPPIVFFLLQGIAWGGRLLSAGLLLYFDFVTAAIIALGASVATLALILFLTITSFGKEGR